MDIGWTELLVIGVVALIVVGPKDLPGMFRALGQFTAKMRRMAREFQRAMEDAANESGVKDTASDLRDLANPKKMGLDKIKEAASNLDPTKPSESAKNIGPETAKLAEERAAEAKQIREEQARKARENAEANAAKWSKPEGDSAGAEAPVADTSEDAPKPEAGG